MKTGDWTLDLPSHVPRIERPVRTNCPLSSLPLTDIASIQKHHCQRRQGIIQNIEEWAKIRKVRRLLCNYLEYFRKAPDILQVHLIVASFAG